jgi:hypothetical protein
MRYLCASIILLAVLTVFSCSSTKTVTVNKSEARLDVNADSTEYDIIVLDPDFESFLVTEAKPMNFYTDQYYRNWNILYTREWNNRCNNTARYGSFYSVPIDYSPNIDYGIELNYKLYNYFLFVEKRYKTHLVRRGSVF